MIYCECERPQVSTEGPNCLNCKRPIVGEGEAPKIPPEIVDLCKRLLVLCKEAGCSSVDLKLNPGWRNGFHSQVQVQWNRGRHDEASRCVVRTELLTHLEA